MIYVNLSLMKKPWRDGRRFDSWAPNPALPLVNKLLSVSLPRAQWPVGSAKVAPEAITLLRFLNHRTHLTLNKETPIPSLIYKPPDSKLVTTLVLHGLYHTYSYQKAA